MKTEDKAIKRILNGELPERKILVSFADTTKIHEKEKKEREERNKRAAERLELFKDVRMPYSCPVCNKSMNKKLDRKFWFLRKKCMDCSIKEETKMRINGTWDVYEKRIILNNKISYLKEQLESIEHWKKLPAPTFQNQVAADGVTVDREKWHMNVEFNKKLADAATNDIKRLLTEATTELANLK